MTDQTTGASERHEDLGAVGSPVQRPVGRPYPKRKGLSMMRLLDELITAAVQLAGADAVSNGARLWQSEGGRACPLDWDNCSQAVYVDLKTGEYDYGEPGGPGHADCVRHCPHGMEPPPPDEEPERVEDGGDAPEEYGPTPMQPHAYGLL